MDRARGAGLRHPNGHALPASGEHAVTAVVSPAFPDLAEPAGGAPTPGGSIRRLRAPSGRSWASYRERWLRRLAQARRQAERAREQAREEGFREGIEAGREQGRREGLEEVQARLQATLQALRSAVEEAVRRRDEALRQADADVVKLALAVAERVIRREVSAGPQVTAAVLGSILQEMPQPAGRVVVRVHPDEHRLLTGMQLDIPGRPGALEVTWVADPAVSPGGCRVETEMGSIDAGLETRLSGVAAAVMDVMRRGR
ncbi:MAG: hypothetical protein IMX02_04235 [Limnochordaceae bacterium]|nr:hypothetical protein [Limnochordaceae bacterium]